MRSEKYRSWGDIWVFAVYPQVTSSDARFPWEARLASGLILRGKCRGSRCVFAAGETFPLYVFKVSATFRRGVFALNKADSFPPLAEALLSECTQYQGP